MKHLLQTIQRIALVLVLTFAGSIGVMPLQAHAATVTDPPMGLMIQVSSLAPTYTPATLKTWLDQIRTDHRNRFKPAYINSVVLQDIADANGNLYTSYLDVLAPYLPGGATPAFDTAYVGTVDLPWTGTGSKYIEGIEDGTFRNQNVSVSATAASAFKARYPRAAINWYVTYEANMAGFWDSNIEAGYKAYFAQLMPALSGVYANKAFMWSPAFWTMYQDEPSWAWGSLQANLTDLFTTTPSRLTIDLQDFVGQSGGASTKESALAWAQYLQTNWSASLTKVQINAEQFTENTSGVITAGDPVEVPTRENYYASNGVTVGPSWEIRYWHQRLYGN